MLRPIHLGTCVLMLAACSAEVPIVDLAGECATVFGSQVCTTAQTRGDSLLETGVTIPLATIEASPTEHPMAWPPAPEAVLGVPSAAQPQAGLQQFSFFWEAGGHPPQPFLTPHYDFHFYFVPAADRLAIDCSDRTKPVTLPSGYGMQDVALPPEMAAMTGVDTLYGTCVPQMGMHALPLSELASTVPFRGSMVVGYYRGEPYFLEPMLSKAMLMEKKSFDLAIPEIPGVQGPYPRTFKATWNEADQSYRFAFSGFAAGS